MKNVRLLFLTVTAGIALLQGGFGQSMPAPEASTDAEKHRLSYSDSRLQKKFVEKTSSEVKKASVEMASEAENQNATEDKSGTNPLNFQKEFRIFNEVQFLRGSGYQNITTVRTSGTFELEAGQIIGTMMGGIASVYARPGVGFGTHRVYNWNIEFGFKVIGF